MKMDKENEKSFRYALETFVRECATDCYYKDIVESIYNDVKDDVETCADESFSADDIRLAIGRVLVERLGKLPF